MLTTLTSSRFSDTSDISGLIDKSDLRIRNFRFQSRDSRATAPPLTFVFDRSLSAVMSLILLSSVNTRTVSLAALFSRRHSVVRSPSSISLYSPTLGYHRAFSSKQVVPTCCPQSLRYQRASSTMTPAPTTHRKVKDLAVISPICSIIRTKQNPQSQCPSSNS